MSLLLNMLSRLLIIFLPRSNRLLISWLQSPSAVILEPQKKIKSDTVSTVSPSISHEVMAPDAMIFVFWMLSFKPTFSLCWFTFIKRLFSSSSLSAIRVVSSAYLRLLYFSQQSWFQLVVLPVQRFSWCTLHRRTHMKSRSVKPLGLSSTRKRDGFPFFFLLPLLDDRCDGGSHSSHLDWTWWRLGFEAQRATGWKGPGWPQQDSRMLKLRLLQEREKKEKQPSLLFGFCTC